MHRFAKLTVCAVFLFVVLLGSVRAQTYIWTGVGNGWFNQNAPGGAGGEDLVFGDSVRQTVSINGNLSFDTLLFEESDSFLFVPGFASNTLTITGGLASTSGAGFRADFAENLTINLTGTQNWDLQGEFSTVTIHGQLTGTGNLTLTGINQTLLLANLTANPSNYTGSITLTTPTTSTQGLPSLVLWGPGSIGTGDVIFSNGGNLITHNAPVLGNNFVLNSGSLLSGQTQYSAVRFRNWDGPATTLTGTVTLANNTTLFANVGFAVKLAATYPNNTGSRPLPGPLSRHPLILTGNVGETGGARSLNATGPGIFILAGTNTYTGGTAVGFSAGSSTNANGSLVFGTQSAIPVTGPLQSGLLNVGGATGYLGIATSAVPPV
jgi:autotransporter-associated beta strand protein